MELGHVWGDMEEVGKCGEEMGKCVGVWGRCRGCGEVWGRCGRAYRVSVELVGKRGKVCWDVGKCVRRCGKV